MSLKGESCETLPLAAVKLNGSTKNGTILEGYNLSTSVQFKRLMIHAVNIEVLRYSTAVSIIFLKLGTISTPRYRINEKH